MIEMPAAVFPQKSKQTVPRNLKDIEINFQITQWFMHQLPKDIQVNMSF